MAIWMNRGLLMGLVPDMLDSHRGRNDALLPPLILDYQELRPGEP